MEPTEQTSVAAAHLGQKNGKAMSSIGSMARAERERLEAAGLLKPYTVVNFNPIALHVECDLLKGISVPEAGKGKTVTVQVLGQKFTGSAVTLRNAIIRPRVSNVTRPADAAFDECVTDYNILSVLPVEQAWLYHHEYSTDGSSIGDHVGGVLAFEGDVRLLATAPKEILIPQFKVLSDRTRQYFGETASYTETIMRVLQAQKDHCFRQMSTATAMDNSDEDRRNITSVHRAWASYALKMGWIQQQPRWVFAKSEPTDVCSACGGTKKHPNAQMCVCGKWYDPFSAFMAGQDVPMAQLITLPEDKLAKVKAELARRKHIEDELMGVGAKAGKGN